MIRSRVVGALAVAALVGCGAQGTVEGKNPFTATPFTAVVTASSAAALAATPAFADERGGGLFVDPSGAVVRLRADGSTAALEAHPGNPGPTGKALRVFPLGGGSALVAAEQGGFLAESGWLIAPAWRDALDGPGLHFVAASPSGPT
ncbi:MAG: hypothetical protein K1X89_14560, partial [Myxococcaceae bacterium]|nr:hypothetical protein [Myxococcaceae bacterium]